MIARGEARAEAPKVSVSRRLFVSLAIVAALSPLGLMAASGAIWQVRQLISDEQHEDRVEDAERCVDNHERVALLRDAIERSTGRGAHAGATAVGRLAIRLYDPGSLPPDLLDQLGQEADREAAAEAEVILTDYPDPECDLSAARALLEGDPP